MKSNKIVICLDGEIGIVEKVENEFHSGLDQPVDVYTIRWANGGQSKMTNQGMEKDGIKFLIACPKEVMLDLLVGGCFCLDVLKDTTENDLLNFLDKLRGEIDKIVVDLYE